MLQLMAVGFGGMLGAIFRYLVNICSVRMLGQGFPYGTLIVNVVGGFLMGLLMQWCVGQNVSPTLRLFLTTGILGGFTTFSAFSYETLSLFSTGQTVGGLANILLNVSLSIVAVACGMVLMK